LMKLMEKAKREGDDPQHHVEGIIRCLFIIRGYAEPL